MKLVKSEDAAESEATIDKIISLAKEDPEIQKNSRLLSKRINQKSWIS